MTKGYIGSYTKNNGQGIYQFDFDEQQGQMTQVETANQIEASTYLTRNDQFLYAITKEGDNCGVASFKIGNDGQLTLINKCLASQMEQVVIYKYRQMVHFYLKRFMVQD